ncbi:MAG: MBL fold metallo-hydrolase [Deltaproteobacteria bacterium]|nr:MBL fold metallo-hydrolase [Deltaproteobacteria bacterium]
MKETVQEIAPGLYRISIPLAFGLDFVHTYAALEQDRVALFDTGPSLPSSFSMYKSALARIGRSIEDVDRIFITHSHVDHCGFAGRIKEISEARIFLSEVEFEAITRAHRDHRKIESIGNFWRQYGLDEKTIVAFSTVLDAFTSATAPFLTNHFLNDGALIKIGGRTFCALFTPGHTRGHLSFYLPEEQIFLSGDCILPHITPNLSPDPACPTFLPLENFIGSLERIRALPVKTVYPAHGEPFEDLPGRVKEIIEHHIQRKDLTWRSVSNTPQLTSEISKRIFGDSLSGFDQGLAFNETYVHLLQLEKEGKIGRSQINGRIFFYQKEPRGAHH